MQNIIIKFICGVISFFIGLIGVYLIIKSNNVNKANNSVKVEKGFKIANCQNIINPPKFNFPDFDQINMAIEDFYYSRITSLQFEDTIIKYKEKNKNDKYLIEALIYILNDRQYELIKPNETNEDCLILFVAKYFNDQMMWSKCADLLGEMKATEAVDSLIIHINERSAGTVSGFNKTCDFPAMIALIKIGPSAIPKILETIKNGKDIEIKRGCLQALIEIIEEYNLESDVKSAIKKEMKRLKRKESNEMLKQWVKYVLDAHYRNNR